MFTSFGDGCADPPETPPYEGRDVMMSVVPEGEKWKECGHSFRSSFTEVLSAQKRVLQGEKVKKGEIIGTFANSLGGLVRAHILSGIYAEFDFVYEDMETVELRPVDCHRALVDKTIVRHFMFFKIILNEICKF